MRGLYEDFIDSISTDDIVINDMNDERELISQQPAEEWYKEMSASGKYNSIFIIEFQSSQEARTNIRLIKKAQTLFEKVLGSRNEISDIHVSTLATAKDISPLKIPKDSIYDGILNWTNKAYPIYVKVACNFRGTVDSMLDTMLRLYKSRNAFYNESCNADIMMIRHQPDMNLGWRYTTANGSISSFIDDAIDVIIRDTEDRDYWRTNIHDIACQLYDMNIWPEKGLEDIIHIVSNWSERRRKNTLNEDFISVDDIQNDIIEDEPGFFHKCPYNTCIIVKQNNDRGEYSQKIVSLARRVESTLKMLLGKCFVQIGTYNEKTARLTGGDVYVFNEEEIEFMYPYSKHRDAIDHNKTETFIWFDMPKRFDKFCELCKVFEELIEKAYGAFKSPEDVCIGFIEIRDGNEVLTQTWCPYVTFAKMYDCESEEEVEELLYKDVGRYQVLYQNAFGKEYQLEEIGEMERDYMRKRIEKNKKMMFK